ncbi:MAG: aldo/keto reductase [Anaerolineae bacterium]|jgi:predicted aldo/keto reductase-like oxidoreductase
MKYRQFGSLDWKGSALGFGCMRLPTANGNDEIDEQEAARMVRYAIDQGVNYVDTAYPYHGGHSEPFLGRVLQDGYREKVRLATKLPSWKIEARKDFDTYLNEQLERLRTEHIDFYLLHALRENSWHKLHNLGVVEWAERAKRDGRIGHLGFSFHDEYAVFKEIVDAYDWTFCQIQYNYMDIDNQAGTKGLKYAASKGLAVVIMEPLLGGRLVDPPQPVQKIWREAPRSRTPADWALQWLWSQPEVSVVLSGMSAMSHVEENVVSAAASAVGALTEEELGIVDRVREAYQTLCPIPCTKCGYCMPCPHGVDIPRNLEIYNEGAMYEKPDGARNSYGLLDEDKRASACTACQECEEECPQSIPIGDWMVHVHEVLGQEASYVCELP